MLETTAPHLAPHDQCTACGACVNGCPKGAIHLLPDREGFLYPTITDACIQCGHCAHVCPVLKQREKRPEPMAFAVWNSDEAQRQTCTAGGVFPLLAEFILEDGGVVFGAAMDEKLHVRHRAVTQKADLPQLCGAKPVQSEIGDSYALVRRYLDRGRRVLFTGTPCQVDGLYRYLGEHPEKLLTVDILCSSVASPGVWDQLVRSMAYIKQHEPRKVEFFAKLEGEKERRFRVSFEGGTTYDAPLPKSEFGSGLRRRLFLRPACHTCPYMNCDRVGDLSLGIFLGLGKEYDTAEQRRGISLLLVNSAKGAHMFDTLPLKREKRPLSEAVAANPALNAPLAPGQERAAFFEAYAHHSFSQVQGRFLNPIAPPRRSAGAVKARKKFSIAAIFKKRGR